MKRIAMLSIIFLMVIVQTTFGAYVSDDDTIVSVTKQAVLIIAGKVTSVESVQPDMSRGKVYRDVTITVSEVLKGKPNIDDQTVRFRIEGGTGIHPMNGRVFTEYLSTNIEFPIGDEMILFIIKRTWANGWPFYDGLFPIMHPFPPQIVDVTANGNTQTVAQFQLGFFEEKYTMNIPTETAFRFIRAAAKAPDATSLLEEKIRPIQALNMERMRNPPLIEDAKFIAMLDAELTRIEALIKEMEAQDENPNNDSNK